MLPCFVTESLSEVGEQLGLYANGTVGHEFLSLHATTAFVNPIESAWAKQSGPAGLYKRELACQGGIEIFKVGHFLLRPYLDITVKAT